MDKFLLQGSKEALDHGIVPTVALATHTAYGTLVDRNGNVTLSLNIVSSRMMQEGLA